MKLITGLACLVAATKAFEAGDYIMSRVDSTIEEIYTPLENGGYDIHIGEFIHLRREGNSIVNKFKWGFEDSELDWATETISWTESSFNYRKESEITVERYPFMGYFYPIAGISKWAEDFKIEATWDVTGSGDVAITHVFKRDDSTATRSCKLSASLDEVTKSKVSVSIHAHGTVEADDWSEEDREMMMLDYDSYNGEALFEVSPKCENPLEKGCFVALQGSGAMNEGEDLSFSVAYKAQRGGLFIFKGVFDGDSYLFRVVGSDKNSIWESARVKLMQVEGRKGELLIGVPTPWGFWDKCGKLMDAHALPWDDLFETLGDNPYNWLLAFTYAEKVADTMPEDLFNMCDVAKCANIKSPVMTDFFNDDVRPELNGALEYYMGYDEESIEEQDSVVDAQCTIMSGANDIIQDTINQLAYVISMYRQMVNDFTGAKGEEEFVALWTEDY